MLPMISFLGIPRDPHAPYDFLFWAKKNMPCPYFAGAPTQLHWDIPDPASATGTPAEREAVFDAVFNQLQRYIKEQLL